MKGEVMSGSLHIQERPAHPALRQSLPLEGVCKFGKETTRDSTFPFHPRSSTDGKHMLTIQMKRCQLLPIASRGEDTQPLVRHPRLRTCLHNNFTEKTVHACPKLPFSTFPQTKQTDGKLGVSPHPVEASARSFKQNIQHVKKSQRIGGAPFPARLLFFATPTRTQHYRLSNSSTSFLTPKSQRCQI